MSCLSFLFFSFFVLGNLSSPQINLPSFSFGAHGEASMSTAGGLELGMSEEGQSYGLRVLTFFLKVARMR